MKYFDPQKRKEYEYIEPFIRFYFPQKKIKIQFPDLNERNKKAPDFLITLSNNHKFAIEHKRILDEEEIRKKHNLFKNVSELQKALDNLIAKNKDKIKGKYFLHYSSNLKITKKNIEKVGENIIEEIIQDKQNFHIKNVGDFEVVCHNEKSDPDILLAITSDAKFINPSDIIEQCIKLEETNEKFNNIQANKRILLITNNSGFEEEDYFKALAKNFEKLLIYNIDEIWLLSPKIDTNIPPKLLFTKKFPNNLLNSRIKNKKELKLLEGLLSHLLELKDDRINEIILKNLKILFARKDPHKIFDNKYVRISIVTNLGEWLGKNKKYDDLIWLINTFINDPDQADPEEFKEIEEDRNFIPISAVTEGVAYIVHFLALDNYISKALYYTKKLLLDRDQRVKYFCLFPLLKISVNRSLLKGYGERPRKDEYKEFHKLCFYMLEFIKNNPQYIAIANFLCKIFSVYTNLSTKEAKKVLDTLEYIPESAPLFIYFALYRKRLLRNQKVKFNEKIFQKRLKEILQKSDNIKLKKEILIEIKQILDKHPEESDYLAQYIELSKDLFND